MEERDTRVICDETNNNVAHWGEYHDVATHGVLGERGVVVGVEGLRINVIGQRVEVLAIRRIAADDLEVMLMEMEWMLVSTTSTTSR